ncbi:MAG: molybdenum ABC transporter ATP-binding protein [Rhizomicrobium sp.]|jgi:molybdate transport system ATP-binding protein
MSIEARIRHKVGAFTLDVAFSIERPGITVLFGASGSGKTTTINALAGLLKPSEGRIVIGGRAVLDTQAGVFVPPRDRRIGYVFQEQRLFPHMTVHDNLLFGWQRTGRSMAHTPTDIVSLLGLESLLARRPARLSGGEKSRVALGRALLSDPLLLLLDEPLAALDAARREEIVPYLERLRDEAKVPMFYVTHSVEELSRLADDVIVLNAGRIARTGDVFELLSDPEFSSLTGVAAYGAVIPVVVSGHRQAEGLTVLSFDGGTLAVPHIGHCEGTPLRIRVRAEDVLLALESPACISANNVLPAKVTAVRTVDNIYADVQLNCGGARLLARITRASLVRLHIVEAMAVFAIIKSVTIDPRAQETGNAIR